jgi:hypothetical protein
MGSLGRTDVVRTVLAAGPRSSRCWGCLIAETSGNQDIQQT